MAEITKKERFWELDFLRGFCVLLMIIDHFLVSLMTVLPSIWEYSGEFWNGARYFAYAARTFPAYEWAHVIVISIFMLICGISCTLSHSNLKRGLVAAFAAMLITFVTVIFNSLLGEIQILFGVIHMIASVILLYTFLAFIGKQIKKLDDVSTVPRLFEWIGRLFPAIIGLIIFILFFVFLGSFEITEDGGIALISRVILKDETWGDILSMFVYVKNYSFASADHFPILPYGCLILIGSGIGELLYKSRAANYLKRLDGKWNKPICFVGRHALIVYLLHQVAIAVFLFAAGVVFKTFIA